MPLALLQEKYGVATDAIVAGTPCAACGYPSVDRVDGVCPGCRA